jgi:hypothetical protein
VTGVRACRGSLCSAGRQSLARERSRPRRLSASLTKFDSEADGAGPMQTTEWAYDYAPKCGSALLLSTLGNDIFGAGCGANAGMQSPTTKQKPITTTLPSNELAGLDQLCERLALSLSQAVREVIRWYVAVMRSLPAAE